jgi:hypothetical protein
MEWYTLHEISFTDFVECVQDIYNFLNTPRVPKNNDIEDVFRKSVLQNFYGISNEKWDHMENQRRQEKVFSMKMGEFHEKLLGKFPEYMKLRIGNETGCDIRKRDGTRVEEVKNQTNTMNESSAKSVNIKLLAQADKGCESYLIQINTPPNGRVCRSYMDPRIKVISGRQAYTERSGSSDFFDRIERTLGEAFKRFKTWKEICEFRDQLIPVG